MRSGWLQTIPIAAGSGYSCVLWSPRYEYSSVTLLNRDLRKTPSESAAGRRRCARVHALVADRVPRQIVLDEQDVRLRRTLDDFQEVGHARDLLALFLQEPVCELLADVVSLLARERGERDDLLRHFLLLR